MSRLGNCYDNAAAESFCSSLKKERVRRTIYPTRQDARADVFDYIEVFCNRTRRHNHLGQVSPEHFKRASVGTCNQIREGILTRERGLEMVRVENRPRWKSIRWYCDTIRVDFEQAIRRINLIPKLYGES